MTKLAALCVRLGCSGALVFLLAAGVRAQELPDPTSYVLHHGADGGWLECDGSMDCRAIKGKRGVWFELEIAEKLVHEHRAYADMEALVAATEQKTKLVEGRLTICQDALNLADAEAHGAEAAIDDAVAGQRDAEDQAAAAIASRDAWYNGKLLWYGAGLATAMLGAVATVMITN